MPKPHFLWFLQFCEYSFHREKCRFGISYDILSKIVLLRNVVLAFFTALGIIGLRIRGTSNHITNTETLIETTGPPSGENESYPDDLILNPCHQEKSTRYGHNDSPTNNRNYSGHSMMTRRITRENSQNYEIKAYFADMSKLNNLTYSEYLHIDRKSVV